MNKFKENEHSNFSKKVINTNLFTNYMQLFTRAIFQAPDVQLFPERGWCSSYLLGIMNGSTVVLNLTVMFEEHTPFHLSCAFHYCCPFWSSLLAASAHGEPMVGSCQWQSQQQKPRLLGLVSVFVNFLCCAWNWDFKDFSEQSHCFRNPIQLRGIRKTCIQSTCF